jgi:AAA+ superfamily predicted ATPase
MSAARPVAKKPWSRAVTATAADTPAATDPFALDAGLTVRAQRPAWRVLAEVSIERHVQQHWRRAAGSKNDAAEPISQATRDLDAEFSSAWASFEAELVTPAAFTMLVARAQLSVDEAAVLAVAVAAEMDERLQHLLVYVHGDPARSRVELGDLGDLFDAEHPGVACLGSDEGPRRAAFVSLSTDAPWSRQAVVVQPSLLWALQGDSAPDPDLPIGATVFPVDLAERDGDGAEIERHRSVLIVGDDAVRRRQAAARHVAAERLIVTDVPVDDVAWSAVVREASLIGAGIALNTNEALTPTGRRWIERTTHLSWALSSVRPLPLDELPDRGWSEVEASTDVPTDEEWAAELGVGVERSHQLSSQQLELVGRAHRVRKGDVDAAVRRLVSGKLDGLARRIVPNRTWDDMVIGPERLGQLQDVVRRYRHSRLVYDDWAFQATPSRGLVALFSGPSGTGKTMAAEVIAGDLGLDLFKLELSAVVSKYIGETEKNLDQLFTAASTGNLVLFFDEADSMFGKRSEVRDARDRYANIEVSYLLQRLESYDGMVIMATNFEKNIDDAFLRRIHSRVDFVVPEAVERQSLWELQFPPQAPVDQIDFPLLAQRFELAGGSIRNVAVHAAFLAASAATPITMTCIVRALGREYRKLGRLVKPDDFGDLFELLA